MLSLLTTTLTVFLYILPCTGSTALRRASDSATAGLWGRECETEGRDEQLRETTPLSHLAADDITSHPDVPHP